MKTERMRRMAWRMLGLICLGLISSGLIGSVYAGDAKNFGSEIGPIDQFLMERGAEISLARSAAPAAISGDAEVLVLGRRGYETAVKGKNGFVCIVERSWTADADDPEFGDPELRAPTCYNAAAVRSHLPLTLKKTELALARSSKDQLAASIRTAIDKKELPTPEAGSMCYMMSKDAYFGKAGGHWHPHVMFFVSLSARPDWGEGLPGSPILAQKNSIDQVTVLMIPVSTWSDGTAAPAYTGE